MHAFRLRSESIKRGIRVTVCKGEPCIRVGTPTEKAVSIPLSKHHLEFIQMVGWRDATQIPPLLRVGVTKDPTTIIAPTVPAHVDNWALVHVELNPGVGGQFRYMAASSSDVMGRKRVKQVYDAFPPVGVSVLTMGGIEPESLILMLPGSRFRVLCTGKLEPELPRAAIVSWNGATLSLVRRIKTPQGSENPPPTLQIQV